MAAIQWGVASAAEGGARHLLWVDADYASWPLDSPELLASLSHWLHRPQRRLTMLARDWSRMRAQHPRFCAWRREWGHAVETRTPADDEAPTLPTLLLDDRRVCVRLVDAVHWRGRCSLDAGETRLLHAEFDALAQRSAPDFPVTQLGL